MLAFFWSDSTVCKREETNIDMNTDSKAEWSRLISKPPEQN
jgi:hypothetical protein